MRPRLSPSIVASERFSCGPPLHAGATTTAQSSAHGVDWCSPARCTSPLRDAFADQWFSVAQAEEVTLLRTPYLPKRHLKRLTLVPAEKAGVIEVERAQGSRAGTFTAEAKMRFIGPSGETRA